MDDIYEFDNNEYRIASMQVKAIAYDVVTGITKKRMLLSKTDKNDIINNLISIQDRLIEITDEFDKQLEILEQFEKKNLIVQKESEPEIKEVETSNIEPKVIAEIKAQPNKITLEENNNKPNLTEINNTIEARKISTESEENKPTEETSIPKDSNEKEEMKVSEPTQQEIKEVNIDIDTSNQELTKDYLSEIQEKPLKSEKFKKRFQKTTKGLSKAIMVRQNQLANLRASKTSQEKILIDKGIFRDEEEQQEIASIEIKKTQKKELSDEIERQIEDLTVKANIYYNEEEINKAQELYNKIRELSNQN